MDDLFIRGSVPVAVAARIYGKDASWVRTGIIAGWLPIGRATRNGELVTKVNEIDSKNGRINFIFLRKNYGKTQDIYGEESDSNDHTNTTQHFKEK